MPWLLMFSEFTLLASLHFRQPWNDLSTATETYHQLCVKRIMPTYVQDPESVTRSKRRSLSSNWQFDRLIWKTQKQLVLTPDSLFESIKLFIVIMLYSISSFFSFFMNQILPRSWLNFLKKKTGKEKLRERWEVSETDSEPRRRENIYILVTSWFLVW